MIYRPLHYTLSLFYSCFRLAMRTRPFKISFLFVRYTSFVCLFLFFSLSTFRRKVCAQIENVEVAQFSYLTEGSSDLLGKTVDDFLENEAQKKYRKDFETMRRKRRLKERYKHQSENGFINLEFAKAEKKREEKLEILNEYRYKYHLEHGYFPESIDYNNKLSKRKTNKDRDKYQHNNVGENAFHSKKHILVFGGNGYLGKHIINHLLGSKDSSSSFSNPYNIILVNRESFDEKKPEAEDYEFLSSVFYDDISNWRKNNQSLSQQIESNIVYRINCNRFESIQKCGSLREYFNDLIEENQYVYALLDLSGYRASFVTDLASYVSAYSLVERYIYLSSEAVYEVCPKWHSRPVKEHNDLRSIRPSHDQQLSEEYTYGNEKKTAEEFLHKVQKKYEKNRRNLDYHTVSMNYISLRIPDIIGPREPTHRYLIYHLLVKAQLYALGNQNTNNDTFFLPIPLESDNLYNAEGISNETVPFTSNSEQKVITEAVPIAVKYPFTENDDNEDINEVNVDEGSEKNKNVNEINNDRDVERDFNSENINFAKTYHSKEFSYISLDDFTKALDLIIQLPTDIVFNNKELESYYLEQDENSMDLMSKKQISKLERAKKHNNAFILPPAILGKSIAANNLGLWNSAINIAHPNPITKIEIIRSIAATISFDEISSEHQQTDDIPQEESPLDKSSLLHYIYENEYTLLPSTPKLGPLDVSKAKMYLGFTTGKEADESISSSFTLQSLEETIEQSSRYYEDALYNQKYNEEIRSSLRLFYQFYNYDYYLQFDAENNGINLENTVTDSEPKYKTKEEMWNAFMETLYTIYRNPIFLEDSGLTEEENNFNDLKNVYIEDSV